MIGHDMQTNGGVILLYEHTARLQIIQKQPQNLIGNILNINICLISCTLKKSADRFKDVVGAMSLFEDILEAVLRLAEVGRLSRKPNQACRTGRGDCGQWLPHLMYDRTRRNI